MKKKVLNLCFVFAMTVSSIFSLPHTAKASANTYRVSVDRGYLALRSTAEYNNANEIAELYSGDLVEFMGNAGSDYWYVYSPTYDMYGFTNSGYLTEIGASDYSVSVWTVQVNNGYLALRSDTSYDSSNEIGKLYSGDPVWVYDSSNPNYWYVYSVSLDQSGYVDSSYLYSDTQTEQHFGEIRTVSVKKGYLALRSMKAYEEANELGELYTGDTVQLLDTSDSQYWYVYSPKYDMNGFVNKNYLNGENKYMTRTVHVKKGYLALRSYKAYHESNEIGELYTDDIVQVIDTSDSQYWYVYSPKLNTYGYVNQTYLY